MKTKKEKSVKTGVMDEKTSGKNLKPKASWMSLGIGTLVEEDRRVFEIPDDLPHLFEDDVDIVMRKGSIRGTKRFW